MTYSEMKDKAAQLTEEEVAELFKTAIVVYGPKQACGACGRECRNYVSCDICGVTFTRAFSCIAYSTLEVTRGVAVGRAPHLTFAGVGYVNHLGEGIPATYHIEYAA